MSFFKETDYHGSRTYDVDPAAYVFIDHLRLRVSLTFAWVRLKIERFIRLGVAPTPTSSLIHRGQKHFTLLGTKDQPRPARPPISEIFSLSDLNDRAPNRRIRD